MFEPHYLIINSRFGRVSFWQPASQELRQREAANTSWRGPVWASAPLGLRRGARANPVGVVVVVALVPRHRRSHRLGVSLLYNNSLLELRGVFSWSTEFLFSSTLNPFYKLTY